MTENEIATVIIREAIHVHRSIGPGMLESVYTNCLAYRLVRCGLDIKREVGVPVVFENIKMDCGYRADILVENKVVIEIKSIDAIAPIHISQVVTYLRFLNIKLGILLNFNSILMKEGIKRIANHL